MPIDTSECLDNFNAFGRRWPASKIRGHWPLRQRLSRATEAAASANLFNLFSDAKTREDSVEEVVGVDDAENVAEIVECGAEECGDKLFARPARSERLGLGQGGGGAIDAFAAAVGRVGNE